MKTKSLISWLLILSTLIAFTSCGEDEIPETNITSFSFTSPVSGFGIIDATTQTIGVNVPYGTDLSNITGTVTATSGATVTPDITAGVDFSTLSVNFTVANGSESAAYTVNVVIGENPLKIALIGNGSFESLDAEVKDAYQWAIDTYKDPVVQYFSWAEVADADLSTCNVVWVHHTLFPAPSLDPGPAVSNAAKIFPADAVSSATTTKLAAYAKSGGNLLLSSLATSYVVEIGRVDRKWGPTNYGTPGDEFFANPDNWGISYQPGHFAEAGSTGDYPSDNLDYYIFSGLTTTDVTFENVTYPALFLSDGGNKKDRSHIWDFNRYFNPSDDWYVAEAGTIYPENDPLNARKSYYETQTGSKVRASFEWDPAAGGIELGALVEFEPKGDYTGTTICLGVGAYEWHIMGDDDNIWSVNVIGITKNILDELGGMK
ncbi:MAG: DUF4960 domain-containing protein [Bacteroidales bacterium]|jgi:hypothetical protein|nr:DUF4960 domain-containing protein [Bacteroidales bacterium]